MIGAGNLATNLAKALHSAGHDIIEVYSRTRVSADALAMQVEALPTDNIETLGRDADIYILALKDSVLADIIPSLCSGRNDAVFVHTAGSVSIDIFKGHAVRYGVLYPMQTFSKSRIVDFSVIPVFLEASDSYTMTMLEGLAASVSNDVRQLDSPSRRYLHLAAVFACNFANHCYALAADMVEMSGMTFDCLLPLIDETAKKVHQLPPAKAQTGPAVRFDRNVIDSQSRLLDSSPMSQQIYKLMSESIHQKSKDND